MMNMKSKTVSLDEYIAEYLRYLGIAKTAELDGDIRSRSLYMKLSLLIPVLIHGFYDFCLSTGNEVLSYLVLGFIFILTIVSWRKLKKFASIDRPI